jgi:hypothetical protein
MSKVRNAISNPELVASYLRSNAFPKTDEVLGKTLFGVARPMSQDLTGKLSVSKSRLRSRSPRNVSTGPDAEQLRSEGAVEIGEPYETDMIESLANRFDELLADNQYTYTRGHDGESYTFGMHSSDFDYREYFPEVQGLINDEIRSLVQSYYKSYFKPVRINAWRNHHVPDDVVAESEVYSNYWHFDPHTTDHLKLFVYLTEVTEDDGPFRYVSRSDSRRVARDSFDRSRDGVPNGKVKDGATVRLFTGPKGSAAFCNTTTNLHRASIPAEGHHRDLIQFVFAPATRPLPDEWIDETKMYSRTGSEHNGFKRIFNY